MEKTHFAIFWRQLKTYVERVKRIERGIRFEMRVTVKGIQRNDYRNSSELEENELFNLVKSYWPVKDLRASEFLVSTL